LARASARADAYQPAVQFQQSDGIGFDGADHQGGLKKYGQPNAAGRYPSVIVVFF